MVVREGSNVTLRCAAVGSPAPAIVWRREAGDNISLQDGEQVSSVEGPTFTIPKVNRLHMGAYLCIASNGVPPSVSKRVMLIVHCKYHTICIRIPYGDYGMRWRLR
uniref:Ig-like domain-containing protein n=1 Tax=Anopheles quadriannulatus TaxID=34691 RepID=A0A182XB70_ANOQN